MTAPTVRLEALAAAAGLADQVAADPTAVRALARRAGLDPAEPGRKGRGNAPRWSPADFVPLQLAAGLDRLGAPDQAIEAAAHWARSIDPGAFTGRDLFVVVPEAVARLEPYVPRDRLPYLARAASIGYQITGRAAWVVHLGRRVVPAADQ